MAKARHLFAIRHWLFTSLVLAAATTAFAQSWPQRPVKLLVPFAAGGNIDVMGRLAAARLSETLGQQFIVENRVGGSGIIATEAVARAPSDGYTLLWASTSVVPSSRVSRSATPGKEILAPVNCSASRGADRIRNSRHHRG
jgi:tripartite-type tricarboxylate transporter receptor subunit TctC